MTVCIKERCLKILLFLLAGSVWHSAIANQLLSSKIVSNSAIDASVNISTVKPQQMKPLDQQVSFLSRFNPKRGTIVFQVGGFNASQGNAQNIDIEGLIGDYFTVNNGRASNVLLGLGYYFDGFEKDQFSLLYGVNALYLAHTSVQGDVIQEQLFTNLSYHYSITNYPIYAAAKMFIKNSNGKNDITFDLGIGPNYIRTSHFAERSLDDGITIPEDAFSGQTSTALSVMAGFGIKFNKLLGLPCELGYRFFYLGQGSFKKNNDQFLNTLKTGNNYANALIFSIYA